MTVGAQTQVYPVDPIALDEDFWDRSGTESIDSRVAVPVERFLDSFQWLAEVDLEVFLQTASVSYEIRSRIPEGGVSVCHPSCARVDLAGKTTTIRRRGQLAPRLSFTWVNSLQPVRRWQEQRGTRQPRNSERPSESRKTPSGPPRPPFRRTSSCCSNGSIFFGF